MDSMTGQQESSIFKAKEECLFSEEIVRIPSYNDTDQYDASYSKEKNKGTHPVSGRKQRNN